MYADHGKGEKLAEPRVRPVSVTREEIGNSGYGNDFLSENQKEIEDIKAQAIANGTFMKAPNGKLSLLNEYQWL